MSVTRRNDAFKADEGMFFCASFGAELTLRLIWPNGMPKAKLTTDDTVVTSRLRRRGER